MPKKTSNKVVLGSKFTHVRNEGLSNAILDPYDQKLYCELIRQSWSFGKIQTHKTTWTTLSKLTKISIKRLKKSAAYMESIERDGEKLIEIEKKGMYIMFFVNPYPSILEAFFVHLFQLYHQLLMIVLDPNNLYQAIV